jgi:hypothetical protein
MDVEPILIPVNIGKPPYDQAQFTTVDNPHKEPIKSITERELQRMVK